jgi:DNA-binding NtrC family response regulator
VSAIPRLLVVDDEPDTCTNLSDIFTDLGYQVDVAYDGQSALQLVEQQHYDVALLDLKMPGMDGLELYRRIRKLSAGTVAIIVTAYATSTTAQSALEAGAWRMLSKPVDLGQLLKHVGEAVEQPLILVVDDDPDLCDSLWDLFRERGFRTSFAHDAIEAKTAIERKAFQVVLIDMKLPRGTGADVLSSVQEANPQAKTIVITGYRTELENLVEQSLANGADAVCYKPFDVEQLLETVKRFAG